MSAIEKVVDFLEEKEEKEMVSFWQILGPLFLLSTLAVAAQSIPFDLLLIGGVGLYLSARWGMRGCAWSFALLAVSAGLKHTFLETNHLWALGLEGSLACCLLITALGFEQGASLVDSLFSQIETRDSALKNLEEETAKQREESLSHQVALQEKLATLQKEFEDLKSDHSSILILNEVLRKTSAHTEQEKETLSTDSLAQEARLMHLLSDIDAARAELNRLRSSDPLSIENKKLQDEINGLRCQKEQTHQVNETVVKLHAKEALKAKEAIEEIQALKEEKGELLANLSAARVEVATLSEHLEQTTVELERARIKKEEIQDVQTERNFLQERLKKAEMEIALVKAGPAAKEAEALHALKKEKIVLIERLAKADADLAALRDKTVSYQKDKEALIALQQEKTVLADRLSKAEEEFAALQNKTASYEKDQERLQTLEEEKAALSTKASAQEIELEVLREKVARAQEGADELGALQKEKAELLEQVHKNESEIAHFREKSVDPAAMEALKKERDSLSEMLVLAQEKIQTLSQVEPLYIQLKKQFAEKNEILQQTRADLFKADTELQALKLEKEQISLTPVVSFEETKQELERLDREIAALEEENQQLQELISQMTGETPPDKSKKRPKSAPPSDQDMLF